jgi:hypothetical protein
MVLEVGLVTTQYFLRSPLLGAEGLAQPLRGLLTALPEDQVAAAAQVVVQQQRAVVVHQGRDMLGLVTAGILAAHMG